MAITKLEHFDQDDFNTLVNEFETSDNRTRKFAAKMRQWTTGGDLDPQDKLDLVRYCNHSEDTRGRARDLARRISRLVFGKVISKLD